MVGWMDGSVCFYTNNEKKNYILILQTDMYVYFMISKVIKYMYYIPSDGTELSLTNIGKRVNNIGEAFYQFS